MSSALRPASALRMLVTALTASCALALPLSGQTPAHEDLSASLQRLGEALRERNMAKLSPLLDPQFRAGGFSGDIAQSIIRQVVEAGRIVPDDIVMESVVAEGDDMFRVHARFTGAQGTRRHDLLLTREGRFVEINVMHVQTNNEKTGTTRTYTADDIALRDELLRMLADDQKYRRLLGTEAAADSAERRRLLELQAGVDSANARRLDEILTASGWPGARRVGVQASTGAFAVLQHAPLEMQERFLPLVRQAVRDGELAMSSLALLEDRVLMRRGEKQRYGTQLWTNPATGRLELWPVEDEAAVDARRAAAGLMPLREYLQGFGVTYTPVR